MPGFEESTWFWRIAIAVVVLIFILRASKKR